MHAILRSNIVVLAILLCLCSTSYPEQLKQPQGNGTTPAKKNLTMDEYLAFQQAIKEGRIEDVKPFLQRGANVNGHEKFMSTPLIIAVANNRENIIKLLIDNGADVNKSDSYRTPLMIAASEGHLNAVRALVTNHANLDACYMDGNTALLMSLRHHEILSYLLEQGAYINATNYKGQTALLLAAQYDLPNEVAYLLQKGAKADDAFVQTYKKYLPSDYLRAKGPQALSSNPANPILEGEWVMFSESDATDRVPDDIMKHYRYRFIKDTIILDHPLKDDYSVPMQVVRQFDTPDPRKPGRVVFIMPNDDRGNLFVLAERQGDVMKLCSKRDGWPNSCVPALGIQVKSLIRLKPDPADRDPLSGLIGTWSNGKSEFKGLGFGLRRDGGGYFSTPIFPAPMHWSRTDTGIALSFGLEKEQTEMQLTYDKVRRTLFYKKSDGEDDIFWRVSLQEPPDLEAEARRRR